MSYLYAVMSAVTNAVQTGSEQQLADAKTTMLDTTMQQTQFTEDSGHLQSSEALISKNPGNAGDVAIFNEANAFMQADGQHTDSVTQAMQNQTGQDSSTMQQKVQLEAAVNQISQALSSILSQNY